jgi:hypothetical protein
MRITQPQLIDQLMEVGSLISTRVMRGWMDLVTRNVTNSNDTYTQNLTTQGNMFIEATSPITITLNPFAIEDEAVTVYRNTTAGNVTVTDGFGTDIIVIDQTVISYRYKPDIGWVRGA